MNVHRLPDGKPLIVEPYEAIQAIRMGERAENVMARIQVDGSRTTLFIAALNSANRDIAESTEPCDRGIRKQFEILYGLMLRELNK